MQQPILKTKLHIPSARGTLVARPQLLARLNERLDHIVTLVSAPAGFGKTTLVSAWVQTLGQPVAWLSLDEADNDPSRFMTYLVAALQQIDPTVGEDVLGALRTSPPPPVDALIAMLSNDLLAVEADFVLVLDDFHLIDDAKVHETIQLLVAHQPPQMRLVIATREDPQLPLARLRARGQLVELRASDLRFSAVETAAFLQDVMGLTLDADHLTALDTRIEGWAAGLQLAALSMKTHANPAELIAGLSGNHHFILSYLTEEVLRQQSPEVHTFLLHTSVLDRLTGPLCDAVTGQTDSAALLEQLYANNVFVIPLDDEHRWYRYHHLFADLLRGQLKRSQPSLAPTLLGHASAWYEAQDMPADAIEYALDAGDFPAAVRLLETHVRPIMLQGYIRTIEHWLERLPSEWRAKGPQTNLSFGTSLILSGHLDQVEQFLQNAEAAAERIQAEDPAEAAAISAEALSMRSTVLSIQGDHNQATRLIEKAAQRAPKENVYLQGIIQLGLATVYNYSGRVVEAIQTYQAGLPLWRASGNTFSASLAVANLGLLFLIRGKLRTALEVCQQAIDFATQSANAAAPILSSAYGVLTDLAYERNELETARLQLENLLALGRRGGHAATLAYGNVVLSRMAQAQDDLAEAEQALQQAEKLRSRAMPAWVIAAIVSQRVNLALAKDDVTMAAQALATTGIDVDTPTSYVHEAIHISYLRLLLHLGIGDSGAAHLARAESLADRIISSAEEDGRMGRVIETRILRALIRQAQGSLAAALDDLRRAIALAEPEGYVRLFINEGPAMARLLRALRDRDTNAYAIRLLAAFPTVAKADTLPQNGLPDPLTEREIEVLQAMAQGLTYEETAQKLYVSVNTVRFHVKSLYSKLGANSRTLAIERARELGLL